ncbi:MAG: GNAT family N-acetyltransferase [Gammaproteobacteria bacterium]|nr:GNAT family N-acetyltransferase [Gammaproteobacteria bacterium]
MKLVFHEVTEAPERDAVARLRYRIHVAELGKRPLEADHDREMLIDRHDADSVLLAAFDGDTPVGTVRLTPGTAIPNGSAWWRFYQFDAFSQYDDRARSVTSRLMVLPELRGTLVAAQLLAMAYQRGRELGTIFNFMHCAPGLVAVHEQMGFRRYTNGADDPDVGYRIPMVLIADDRTYLSSQRSPFAGLSLKYPADPGNALWFMQRFGARCGLSTARTLGVARFMELIAECSAQALTGLNGDELTIILESAVLHHFEPGFRVLKRGDRGGDLFLILSGQVTVGQNVSSARQPIASIGPGDCFGDYAYLGGGTCNADITALSEVMAISLSRESFEKLQRKHPALAFRLVLNLAVAASHRFEVTTSQELAA